MGYMRSNDYEFGSMTRIHLPGRMQPQQSPLDDCDRCLELADHYATLAAEVIDARQTIANQRRIIDALLTLCDEEGVAVNVPLLVERLDEAALARGFDETG